MNNIYLSILGSSSFSELLNELQFNNILNSNNHSKHSDSKILVKIIFVESFKISEVKNHILSNEPIILLLNNKNYI